MSSGILNILLNIYIFGTQIKVACGQEYAAYVNIIAEYMQTNFFSGIQQHNFDLDMMFSHFISRF